MGQYARLASALYPAGGHPNYAGTPLAAVMIFVHVRRARGGDFQTL
jgi:hypothetical protein